MQYTKHQIIELDAMQLRAMQRNPGRRIYDNMLVDPLYMRLNRLTMGSYGTLHMAIIGAHTDTEFARRYKRNGHPF